MPRIELALAVAALLATPAAFAQESGAGGHNDHATGQTAHMADLSILPQECRDAIQPSGMPPMDMSAMMESRKGMDEAQMASLQAMMKMNGPMMAAHTIEDPDLAFHCGMIAHHAGAIAMAEVELKYGDDAQSKALAQKIIDAQGPEIEEMTGWVEKNAGRK